MDMVGAWKALVVDGKVPRGVILKIEECMLADAVDTIEIDDHNESCPVTHHFAPGMYAREIFMPKNEVVVGKIHKHAHLSMITQGEVSVLTERGVEHLKAPITFVSFPGAKRVVYMHEDTVWTTFHPTDETDLDKIEDHVIAKSFKEFDSFTLITQSQEDFTLMLEDTGFTSDEVQRLTDSPNEPLSDVEYGCFYRQQSEIAGEGLFTSKPIQSGESMGMGRIDGKRTVLGRYVNHSHKPNAEYALLDNGDLEVVAISDIDKDEEILYDYRQGASMYLADLEKGTSL